MLVSRAQALSEGLRWYYTGRPCPKGHTAKRSVSNRECRGCVDARHRAKRAAEPAPYRNREKRRRDKALDLFKARNRASYAKHKAKRQAYDKARYPLERARRLEAARRAHLKRTGRGED